MPVASEQPPYIESFPCFNLEKHSVCHFFQVLKTKPQYEKELASRLGKLSKGKIVDAAAPPPLTNKKVHLLKI